MQKQCAERWLSSRRERKRIWNRKADKLAESCTWFRQDGKLMPLSLALGLRNLTKLVALVTEEVPHNLCGVLLFAVHRVIHLTHVLGGDAAAQPVEGCSRLRAFLKDLRANNWHGIVGRKVMFVIVEHHKSKRRDQAIRIVAGNHIHGFVLQRAEERRVGKECRSRWS